jgi:hypothetical protein
MPLSPVAVLGYFHHQPERLFNFTDIFDQLREDLDSRFDKTPGGLNLFIVLFEPCIEARISRAHLRLPTIHTFFGGNVSFLRGFGPLLSAILPLGDVCEQRADFVEFLPDVGVHRAKYNNAVRAIRRPNHAGGPLTNTKMSIY